MADKYNKYEKGDDPWAMAGVNGQPPPHERELVWIFRKKYGIHADAGGCCNLHDVAAEDGSDALEIRNKRNALVGKKCVYAISLNDQRFFDLVDQKCRCFIAGTKIRLFSGESVNIEDIDEGTYLLTYNTETNNFEKGLVKQLIRSVRNDLVQISLSDGTVIESTVDHPYFTQKKGWCSASPELSDYIHEIKISKLEIGDLLMNSDGEWVEIDSIVNVDGNETKNVYNFEVDGNHTYFANNILVHNKSRQRTDEEIPFDERIPVPPPPDGPPLPTKEELIAYFANETFEAESTGPAPVILSVNTNVRDGQVAVFTVSASYAKSLSGSVGVYGTSPTASVTVNGAYDNRNTYDATRRYEPSIYPSTNSDKVSVISAITTPQQLASLNIDEQPTVPETPGSDLFRGLQVGGMFGQLTGQALAGLAQYIVSSSIEKKKQVSSTEFVGPLEFVGPPDAEKPTRPNTQFQPQDIGDKNFGFSKAPEYEYVVEWFVRQGGQLIRTESIFNTRGEADAFGSSRNTGGSGVQATIFKRQKGG